MSLSGYAVVYSTSEAQIFGLKLSTWQKKLDRWINLSEHNDTELEPVAYKKK